MKVLDQYISAHASLYHADTCEAIRDIPSASIDFSVFSPPFEGLFTYSASDRDLGNTHGGTEFSKHLQFIANEQFRIHKDGRMVALHCMDLPMTLTHHGKIGFIDFPSRLREVYENAGFIYYGKITIWKDPVIAQERTHARQLVHHEMVKDSAMSGVGCPDYIVLMRKPGKNEVPIVHDGDALATKNDAGKPEHWQRWASPVWGLPGAIPELGSFESQDFDTLCRMLAVAIKNGDRDMSAMIAEHMAGMRATMVENDAGAPPLPSFVWATANGIWVDGFVDYEDPRAGNPDKRGIDQGDTLNFRAAREEQDERHICPLQKGVVDRLLDLYTNPGDVVFTPFMGIGTEVVQAIKKGRRGVGCELKASYFKQAVAHVRAVEPGAVGQQLTLETARKVGRCSVCEAEGAIGVPCEVCGSEIA